MTLTTKEVNRIRAFTPPSKNRSVNIQQLDKTLLVFYNKLTKLNSSDPDSQEMYTPFKIGFNDEIPDFLWCSFGWYIEDSKFKLDFVNDKCRYKDNCCRRSIDFKKQYVETESGRKVVAIWLASEMYLTYKGMSSEDMEEWVVNSEFGEDESKTRGLFKSLFYN